jgi:hypothetical protein
MVDKEIFKNSKMTDYELNSAHNQHDNHSGIRHINEESYESKDFEVENFYESESGPVGIPAGIAMTSHMMNDNILLSFFPVKRMENNMIEEEMKGGSSEYLSRNNKEKS